MHMLITFVSLNKVEDIMSIVWLLSVVWYCFCPLDYGFNLREELGIWLERSIHGQGRDQRTASCL